MRRFLYSYAFLLVTLCSCQENIIDMSDVDNDGVIDSKTPIIIIENPDDYWTRLYYENENEYAFLRVIDRDTSIILGSFDNIQILITVDSNMRPQRIESEDFNASILYRGNKAFAYCVAGEVMHCDTIVFDSSKEDAMRTRSVSPEGVLSYFKTWITSSGLRYIVNYGANRLAPGISALIDYLRITDEMDSDEVLDYQINMYENWDTYLAEFLSGKVIPNEVTIPREWLEKIKDEQREYLEEKRKEEKILSEIIIGLVTGNAPYIYSESAKCLVEGYLKAVANEGSFDFNYGICYSTNTNPTIKDNVVSKSVSSEFFSSITVGLPEQFLLTNLNKNSTYYYRAFFKDNINGVIDYSNVIRSFTTSDIPASISNFAQTNSYHNKSGYTNGVRTFAYKFMTTLKVELTSFDDIMDWGYYYINEEGNRIAYSMMNRNSLRCDDVLEYYSNKPETTIRLGCYVKYLSVGDKAFYSDPQSYNLTYNDDVELAFTDCSFVGITHDNSLGYYRCGVTFDVDFKVQGSQNLTSIVILPYGNFLSWNASSYNSPADGDYSTTITNQYLYEYGLYGNFYCFLYAKDVDGNEYYSDNVIRMYHDGLHFTACAVEPWESLYQNVPQKPSSVVKRILEHK